MDFIARVNPKYLAAVALFRAKNDVRYYLNGIFLEPHPEKGVVITATNGHVIGSIHDPAGFAQTSFIFQPDERIIKACKLKAWQKSWHPDAVWIAERCAVVVSNLGKDLAQDAQPAVPVLFGENHIEAATSALVDGKFPNWRRLFQKERAEPTPGFPWLRTDIMQPFLDAAKILNPGYTSAIHCAPNGPEVSAYVQLEASPADPDARFIGLAMPMRPGRARTESMPTWLERMIAAEQPAT